MLSYQNGMLLVGETLHDGGQALSADRQAVPKTVEEAVARLTGGAKRVTAPDISNAQLLAYLHENFQWVEAAGGAVVNRDSDWLLIYRNGRWDMPKGHVERGETIEDAALREVAEETGLQHFKIVTHAVETYHLYNIYGPWTAKCTHWFVMQSLGNTATTPQADEGITRAEWIPFSNVRATLSNSYPTIRLVWDKIEGLHAHQFAASACAGDVAEI